MRGYCAGMVLLLVVGLAFSGCSSQEPTSDGQAPPAAPSAPESVIVVDVGGLRADHLGCYGNQGDASPEIDALAAEAVLFEWAFGQAPGTAASVAALLTGIYPTSLQMGGGESALAEDAVSLAELVAGQELATAAFLDGGSLRCDEGFGQGFSHCDDSGSGAAEVGGKALSWLREKVSGRALLWVHLGDTLPSPELSADDPASVKALYEGEIRSVDAWVGALRGELRELGALDSTVIALLGSHGVGLGEHGSYLADNLYAPVTRIPFLLRLPGGQHGGEKVSKIVEGVDLVPTVLELLGNEVPEGMQGGSLLPLVEGSGTPPYVAFGESPENGGERYAALGGYRLILNQEAEIAQLFHTAQDPLEQTDLAGAEPDRVAVLKDHLDAWSALVAASEFGAPPAEASLDEAELEKLRTLGYIQ